MAESELLGFKRSWRLFKAFLHERSCPHVSYSMLAADLVNQVGRYVNLNEAVVVDVGGGPGYLGSALDAAGATCVTVDSTLGELFLNGRVPVRAVVGDGACLPVATSSVNVTCSTNMLEHVINPWEVAAELVRITKPYGIIYVSVTNWWSPWGGHETSPWHYVGGAWAARRYERRHGMAPKNLYGTSLFRLDVVELLQWANDNTDVEVVAAFPRYLPPWARVVLKVPLARELVTWNLALVLQRRPR